MPAQEDWPMCRRCDVPMLFRAQLPLSCTSLVSFDDDRLVLVFECHARTDDGICDEGTVRISGGDLVPREAPHCTTYDVILNSLGDHPDKVRRVLIALGDASRLPNLSRVPLPTTVVFGSLPSIAREVALSIEQAGGQSGLRPSPATTLSEMRGGRLVPFDDGTPGVRRTTLPPLRDLVTATKKAAMRGLLGGATPGYRDHSFACGCGRPTRTAVRFLADKAPDPAGVVLGPAVAQVCIKCSNGTLHRLSSAA